MCKVVYRMLNNLLNTNEIKGSTGAEIEFSRRSSGTNETEFQCVTANPSTPNALIIKHQETGNGVNRVRRSVVRFDLTGYGGVDTTKLVTVSAYMVLVNPIGNINDQALPKTCLAELLSFCATTGAGTTVLFDGTGNGAASLLNGSL